VANIKSQIKRIRTNEKARLRNKAAKAEVKTRIKSAIATAEAGAEEAPEFLRVAVKRLDKAASRGIIHRNQAANRKSALMRRVARVQVELVAATDGTTNGGAGPEEAVGAAEAARAEAAPAPRARRTRSPK